MVFSLHLLNKPVFTLFRNLCPSESSMPVFKLLICFARPTFGLSHPLGWHVSSSCSTELLLGILIHNKISELPPDWLSYLHKVYTKIII